MGMSNTGGRGFQIFGGGISKKHVLNNIVPECADSDSGGYSEAQGF